MGRGVFRVLFAALLLMAATASLPACGKEPQQNGEQVQKPAPQPDTEQPGEDDDPQPGEEPTPGDDDDPQPGEEPTPGDDDDPQPGEEQTPDNDKDMGMKIKITAGGRTFSAEPADTEAAAAFMDKLPLTLAMSELNGNEKYFYLDFTLPASAVKPGTIREGDLMLYGSSCVVVFYKTFQSSYSYTRLGSIADTTGLREALGSGDVTVRFEAGE